MIFSKKKKFLYEHNLYNLSIPQKLQKFSKHIISLVNFILWSENLEKINLYSPSR